MIAHFEISADLLREDKLQIRVKKSLIECFDSSITMRGYMEILDDIE